MVTVTVTVTCRLKSEESDNIFYISEQRPNSINQSINPSSPYITSFFSFPFLSSSLQPIVFVHIRDEPINQSTNNHTDFQKKNVKPAFLTHTRMIRVI